MKSNLFTALLLLISTLLFSQTSNDKTIYLDSLWKETSEGNHKYYRIVKDYYSDKDNYKVYDYYKSGALQMEGTSRFKDDFLKEGEFVYYYENGNKKSITNYKKSRPNGKQYDWYENGNKKLEGEYIDSEDRIGNEFKINQFWNEQYIHTVIDGNGNFEVLNEKSFVGGEIKDGFPEGIWKGYNSKSKFTFTEKYENGKFISGISIDSVNVEHKYDVLEMAPKPKKGIKDFYNYIGNNFNYTKASIRNKIKGKIIIEFVVDNEGKIIEPKVKKGLGYGLDEEAIRVLTNYENWIPGEQKGRKVRVLYTIPISLQGSE